MEVRAPLDLLILQASPFCNIDCKYCYLPNRSSTKRMSRKTLEAIFERVFASRFCGSRFTVVWHAGEPLAVPLEFYEQTIELIDRIKPPHVTVSHSFQTNAMLLTEAWCGFIKKHRIQIGVSVDGPEALHDKNRVTRAGAGTHRKVMEGIGVLREHGVEFHVISVLPYESLEFPDEMYDFYVSNDIHHVGFNVEEVEDAHETSSLLREDAEAKFRRFLARFHHLVEKDDGFQLQVREFDNAVKILTTHDLSHDPQSDHTTPFGIISVDWEGNFTTFSPELLGAKSADYDGFAIGNVHRDSFEAAEASEKFLRIKADIEAGIEMCRSSCEYFAVCGGGAPSNKYFENGTFRSTETMYCRLHRMAIVDVFLERAEESIDGLRAPLRRQEAS